LSRNVQQGMQAQTCAQIIAGMQPMPQNLPPEVMLRQQQRVELQQLLPRLELPNTDGMSAPRGGYGGGGSSGNGWEVRATLSGNWTMRRLYNHFAAQIEDQDWERDARAIGRATANGSWTKKVGDDIELIGNLTVLKTADDNYDLRFHMIRVGEAEMGAPALGIRGIPARSTPIGVSEIVRD